MIIPNKLKKGDKVATISISFGTASIFPERYKSGIEELKKKFNVEVVEMPNSLKSHAWLQDHPERRAEDFMKAVEDKDIKAIICNIGGNDSVRFLKYLDIEKIKQNPEMASQLMNEAFENIAPAQVETKEDIAEQRRAAIKEAETTLGISFKEILENQRQMMRSSPKKSGWEKKE